MMLRRRVRCPSRISARTRARAAFLAVIIGVTSACAAVVDLEPVTYGDTRTTDADARESAAADAAAAEIDDAETSAPIEPSACGVRDDARLYCTNRANAPLRALPKASASIVNTLRTTNSYFLCWGTGERHAGGNDTWYYTIGDDNPNLGWLPGVMLNTPDAFDANPSAYGLRSCAE